MRYIYMINIFDKVIVFIKWMILGWYGSCFISLYLVNRFFLLVFGVLFDMKNKDNKVVLIMFRFSYVLKLSFWL